MVRAAKPLFSPSHLLHRASQRADGLFARNVGDCGLTPRQFAILQVVADKNGLSQTDIMAGAGIDRSSTAELGRRRAANDCLQRRRKRRDARVYAVRITKRGREMLRIGASATRAAEEALLLPVPEKHHQAFLDALTSIVLAPDL